MDAFATALAYAQRGDMRAAEGVLNELISRQPNHGDAIHLLANVRHAIGDAAGAVALFERAATLAPNDANLAFNHAITLAGLGRHEAASEAFTRVLELRPNESDAFLARGVSLAALGRYEEALVNYDNAITLGAGKSEAHASRGAALAALGRHEEAVAASDRALALDANNISALFNRGSSQLELRRNEEAVASLNAALARAPKHVMAHAVRATALTHLGRFDEALSDIDFAIEQQPNRMDFWTRRGYTLTAANRSAEAITAYDRVLEASPNDFEAAFGRASVYRALGDYEHGLPAYEGRLSLPNVLGAPPSPAPRWTGAEDLAGKTILVQGEQGFGDLFQFCRFVPHLAARGAKVVLQERPPTLNLLRSLGGVSEVMSWSAPPPPTDYHIPLVSLMLALGARIENVGMEAPYLRAAPERVAYWRDEVGSGRKVGVCWKGGPGLHPLHAGRSISAVELQRLLGARVDWVSVQFNSSDETDLLAQHGVRDFGDAVADFAELAALIEVLDVVVTVDTNVAHLAGALRKPVWIMLPFHADWRWMHERTDSPWYPSARLFRQPRFGEWNTVIDDVLAALRS